MSPWGRPRGLVHNLQIPRNTRFLRTRLYVQERPSSVGVLQPYFQSSDGISRTSLRHGVRNKIRRCFFSYDLLNARKQRNDYWRATYEDNLSRVLKQEIFFWFTSSGFCKRPILFKVLAPASLFYEEAICKGSTVKGLLYAAKQYHKRTTLRTWPWQ